MVESVFSGTRRHGLENAAVRSVPASSPTGGGRSPAPGEPAAPGQPAARTRQTAFVIVDLPPPERARTPGASGNRLNAIFTLLGQSWRVMVESVSRPVPPVVRDSGANPAGRAGSGSPAPNAGQNAGQAAALAQRAAGAAVIVDLSRAAQLLRASLPDGEAALQAGRGGEGDVRAGEGAAAARDGGDGAQGFMIEERRDGIGVVPGFARFRARPDDPAASAAMAAAARRRRLWLAGALACLFAVAFLLDVVF